MTDAKDWSPPEPPEKAPDYWPFKEFRAGQREALLEAATKLAAGKSVLFDAPTGSGKAPIAIALASWAGGGLVTTPQNSLVDQYSVDFGKRRGVAVVKGREHYAYRDATCAVAPCRFGVKQCDCDYSRAKKLALVSPVVVTNMAMALGARWLRRDAAGDTPFPLVIIDEAHNLETAVARHVEASFLADDFNPQPPEKPDWDKHLDWIRLTAAPACAGRLRKAQNAVAVERAAGFGGARQSLLRALDEWERAQQRVQDLVWDADVFKEAWVVQDSVDDRGRRRVTYKPITGTRFVNSKLCGRASRAVLLTATPPTAGEVGLGDAVARVTMPMRFPRRNRPIILDYRGNMSFGNREAAMPNVAKGIQIHARGKTIVHCHAFSIANALSAELRALGGVPHVLQDPEDREGSLLKWQRGEDDIFLSVSFGEGLDLPDDHCRTQIIAKLPVPNLGDAWVQARLAQMGAWWMQRQVARSIVQAYGRGCRHENDSCDTIITDQSFDAFYKRNHAMFPSWFREAIGLPKVDAGVRA